MKKLFLFAFLAMAAIATVAAEPNSDELPRCFPRCVVDSAR